MRLLELDSKIWESLSGYYSELRNNLNLLIQDAPDGDAYEWQEVTTLLITLELEDSTAFFDVLNGVIPYFVEALEKRKREGDVRSQVDLITKSGLLLLPYQGKGATNNVKNPDIISVFEESISKLQEYAKVFWEENAAYVKRADIEKRRDFCIAMLAIMGDTRLASVLRRDLDADTFRLTCDNCGESHELINKARRVTFKNIVPAEPVNGCWDGVNYQDTYIWLSNMAEQGVPLYS